MINSIAIASDHAGYKLKQYLIDNLGEEIISHKNIVQGSGHILICLP